MKLSRKKVRFSQNGLESFLEIFFVSFPSFSFIFVFFLEGDWGEFKFFLKIFLVTGAWIIVTI